MGVTELTTRLLGAESTEDRAQRLPEYGTELPPGIDGDWDKRILALRDSLSVQEIIRVLYQEQLDRGAGLAGLGTWKSYFDQSVMETIARLEGQRLRREKEPRPRKEKLLPIKVSKGHRLHRDKLRWRLRPRPARPKDGLPPVGRRNPKATTALGTPERQGKPLHLGAVWPRRLSPWCSELCSAGCSAWMANQWLKAGPEGGDAYVIRGTGMYTNILNRRSKTINDLRRRFQWDSYKRLT